MAYVKDSDCSLSSESQLYFFNVLLIDGRIMFSEENAEMSRYWVKCLLFLGIHLEGLTAGSPSTGYCSLNGS